MCVQASGPMHKEGGQKRKLSVLLYHWPPYSLEAESLMELGASQVTGVAENSHPPILPFYSTEVTSP